MLLVHGPRLRVDARKLIAVRTRDRGFRKVLPAFVSLQDERCDRLTHIAQTAGIAARPCGRRRPDDDRGRHPLSIARSLRGRRGSRATWPHKPVAMLRTVLTTGREAQSICRSL